MTLRRVKSFATIVLAVVTGDQPAHAGPACTTWD
jgi:hypothetical protein